VMTRLVVARQPTPLHHICYCLNLMIFIVPPLPTPSPRFAASIFAEDWLLGNGRGGEGGPRADSRKGE